MSNAQTEAWTNQRLLQWTADFFKTKESDAPRLAAEVLLAAALGCERIELYTRFNEIPVEPQLGNYRDWVKRHGAGEPVAYLVGHQEFYSLKFNVSSAVLIPRPETEHVVMEALDCAKGLSAAKIVDIGTGSGCIAVTLATQLKNAEILAVDLSPEALAVAQSNTELHNVSDRVTLLESDLFDSVPEGKFDIIVSNPPYVGRQESNTVQESVAKYEPDLALYGGDAGTEIIARLIDQSAQRLNAGGIFIFELSPMIAAVCLELVKAHGAFESVELKKDYGGLERFIVAKLAG